MNIVTESHLQGQPIGDKAHKRPVRMVRWFIIVGLLLALLVGGLVWFNYFRGKMIAQFFANNKPPPASVSIAVANSETIPNLLTAVGVRPGQCRHRQDASHHLAEAGEGAIRR